MSRKAADEPVALESVVSPSGGETKAAGAFAHYYKAADWDFYDLVADRIGLPYDPPPGMLAHFAGETGPYNEMLDVFDLWTRIERVEEFFAEIMSSAITDAIAAVERRPDVQPKHKASARVILGADAHRFVGAAQHPDQRGWVGHASKSVGVGYVMLHAEDAEAAYMAGCEVLGFPENLPTGMIIHVAGRLDDGWMSYDAWDDERHAVAWYERIAREVMGSQRVNTLSETMEVRRSDLKRIVLSPLLFAGLS